jgi:hypothetical protein
MQAVILSLLGISALQKMYRVATAGLFQFVLGRRACLPDRQQCKQAGSNQVGVSVHTGFGLASRSNADTGCRSRPGTKEFLFALHTDIFAPI